MAKKKSTTKVKLPEKQREYKVGVFARFYACKGNP
jgi:hypothetical protein